MQVPPVLIQLRYWETAGSAVTVVRGGTVHPTEGPIVLSLPFCGFNLSIWESKFIRQKKERK